MRIVVELIRCALKETTFRGSQDIAQNRASVARRRVLCRAVVYVGTGVRVCVGMGVMLVVGRALADACRLGFSLLTCGGVLHCEFVILLVLILPT